MFVIIPNMKKFEKKSSFFQKKFFSSLINEAKQTSFGKEHDFTNIKTYNDYIKAVPVREYEAFEKYISRIKNGEENVLWKGKPIYFAKSSGTTSGVKYIPITRFYRQSHQHSAKCITHVY